MALGAGRRIRQAADNPLPGDPAMSNAMDANRRALGDASALENRAYYTDRAGMAGALAGLQGLADGTGPSLAREQLANQAEANLANQMAVLGAARGGNLNATTAAAATTGMQAQADLNAAMAEQRAAEQINALNAAGNLAGTMAGMSSGRQLGMMGMGQDALGLQFGAANERELARAQLLGQRADSRATNRLQWANFGLNAGGQVVGGLAKAISDERFKVEIEAKPSIADALASLGKCPHCGRRGCDAEHEAESMGDDDEDDEGGGLAAILSLFGVDAKAAAGELGKVGTYSWEYSDEAKAEHGAPEGRLAGVMAQELEAAGPLGKAAVIDGEPKTLHPAKSIGLALAAAADHEQRMRKVETLLGVDEQGEAETRRAKRALGKGA